jgi:hypothetical protein
MMSAVPAAVDPWPLKKSRRGGPKLDVSTGLGDTDCGCNLCAQLSSGLSLLLVKPSLSKRQSCRGVRLRRAICVVGLPKSCSVREAVVIDHGQCGRTIRKGTRVQFKAPGGRL